MDNRIRKNEVCVVGLPRCDFVFSATRSCFIAYGFNESSLEMTILKSLLGQRGIQPVEAGGTKQMRNVAKRMRKTVSGVAASRNGLFHRCLTIHLRQSLTGVTKNA
jgi:hypothetical protein